MVRLGRLVFSAYICSFVLFDREGWIWLFHLSQLLVIIFALGGLKKGFALSPPEKMYLSGYFLLLFFGVLSTAFSPIPEVTLGKCMTMGQIFMAMILSRLMISTYQIDVRHLLMPILICLLFNVCLYFLGDPVHFRSWRFQGTRDNPNYLSVFSCYTFVMFALFKDRLGTIKRWFPLILIITGFLVFVSASKKGIFLWVFLALGMFFQTIRKHGAKVILLSIPLGIALAGLNVFDFLRNGVMASRVFGRINEFVEGEGISTLERQQFLKSGVSSFLKSPIFGSGLDNMRTQLGTYSHSNIIELLTGVGVVGTTAYFLQYLALWRTRDYTSFNKRLIGVWFLCLMFLEFTQVSYYYKWSILSGFLMITFITNEDSNSR